MMIYIVCAFILLAAALLVPVLLDALVLPRVRLPAQASRPARIGDAISQVGNVLIFNGDPNYSISGDAWRFGRRRTMAVANWLFRDPEHCRLAYEGDVAKARTLLATVDGVLNG